MHGRPAPPLDTLRDAIAAAVPSLCASTWRVLNDGWDSVAVEVDGQWIFKFPRYAAAEARLRRECSVLGLVRPRVAMPLPEMMLHEKPRLFSQHRKLPGSSLEVDDYGQLSVVQRDRLADALAAFYAQLHAIPQADARAAGAAAIDPWLDPDETARRALPALPARLVPFLHSTLDAYRSMPGDDDNVFGYFDGHGWNMAFDHATGTLNGVFDFADSGFGARHQDLSYSNWISPDLTLRIIARYEQLTGQAIDRDRVMLYSAVPRLVEFARSAPDHPDFPARLRAVEDWFGAAD